MIWFALAMFAISFLATVFLAPKPELEKMRPGRLSDIRFPTADEGSPVPIIYGRVRLRCPNCIWYGDFKTIELKKRVKTGWFTSKTITIGYSYYISFQLGLCLGPGVKLRKIWVEKKVLHEWVTPVGPEQKVELIDKSSIFGGSERGGGFRGIMWYYGGEFTQQQNSYLAFRLGSDVPSYPGIAYVLFTNCYIGTSPQLRALSFELERYSDNLGLDALGTQIVGEDLNPMEILYSLLIEEWGSIGLDSSELDTDSFIAAATTLHAEGNGMSVVVSSPNEAKSVVQEVLRQVDGILYQDAATAKISVYLIREDYDVEELPIFDDSNVMNVRDFGRSGWSETYNQVRVSFTYRDKKYQTAAAFAQDMANINQQGRIRSTTISFPGCTEEGLAAQLAARELSQLSVPLFKATLNVTRAASDLHPGSPILWSHEDYGLSNVVMRVQRFDLGSLTKGQIVIDVIQDLFAASDVVYSSPEGTLWEEIDRTPVDITEYKIFESPYWFLQQIDEFTTEPDSAYLWALTRRPDYMQAYDFITSGDDFDLDTTVDVERQEFPPSARLTSTLFKVMGQTVGKVDQIIVDDFDLEPDDLGGLWEEENPLRDSSATGIRSYGDNLMMINGEILAYETYTSLGSGSYKLENVWRALLDTQFEDHTNNDMVYFLTGINWLSRNPRPDTTLLWYKLLSYSDQGSQDIEDVSAFTFTPDQRYDRPLPPDSVEIDKPSGSGVRCPIEVTEVNALDVVTWDERNRTDPNEVVLIGDSSDTPEVGTTYNVRFKLDGVIQDEVTGTTLASAPISLTGLNGSGTGRIEIEASRGGLISHTEDFIEFYFTDYENLSIELVTDGRFESDLSNWTQATGTWSIQTTDYPLDPVVLPEAPNDTKHVQTDSAGDCELTQSTDVSSYQGQPAIFRVWRGSLSAGVKSQVKLELIELPSTVIDTITTPLYEVPLGKWEKVEIPFVVTSDTDEVKIHLMADGPNAAFDHCTLKANPTAPITATKYDSISGLTVVGVWGLRQLVSTYTGPLVRIRDTADDSETDIGQDGDGNLKPYSVLGQARVVKLYDQLENDADLIAESVVKQPLLRSGRGPNSRPEIKFDNGTALVEETAGTTRPYMVTRPNCCLAIGPRDSSGTTYIATIPHIDDEHTSPYYRWGLTAGTNDWRYRFNEETRIDSGNGDPDLVNSVWFADAYNGAVYHNDDTTAIDSFTAADTTYPNSTRLRFAEDAESSTEWDGGRFYELAIFTGDISSTDRQTIMESIALYWFAMSV